MRGALAIVALTTLASFGGPTLSAVSAAPAVAAVEPQHPFSSWSAPSASDSSSSERERVRLTLGVMSRCPDAVLVEALFDRVLERKTSLGGTGEGAGAEGGEGQGEVGTVAGLVDLRLEYIGDRNSSALYDVSCKHGDIECKGNAQQLCAMKHWTGRSVLAGPAMERSSSASGGRNVRMSLKGNQGWEDWWNFVQCLNYGDLSRIGTDAAARSCAEVARHEWGNREQHCVEGKEGKHLLRKSVKRARKLGVERSATILLNERIICVHDGTWKDCPGGHEVVDFVREIEAEWKRLNPDRKRH
ncbi:hypothetical protein JCM8202_001481 [Rhodotorula sphaerocarpa]